MTQNNKINLLHYRFTKFDHHDDLMFQKNLKFFVLMIYFVFLDE